MDFSELMRPNYIKHKTALFHAKVITKVISCPNLAGWKDDSDFTLLSDIRTMGG